jgi:hypothetical protein
MSHRPATSHPCAIWFGSPDTVAALLRRDVRSHHIVAYPLRTSGRSASFCRCLATPISCMHLMPAIRCVWPVTYTFNALPAPCAWRGHDGPDVRRLGNARVRPGAESHWTRGGGSGATGHVPVPKSCRAVVPVPRPRGDARASLRRGWACSHESRGESRAFSCRVTGSVPRAT